MNDNLLNTVTINSLKYPFSFEGEFVILKESDLLLIFSAENSFKTKFYTLLIVEAGSGIVIIDNDTFEITKSAIIFVDYNQVFRFSGMKDFRGEVLLFTKSFYNLIYTGNRKIKNDTAFSGLPSLQNFSVKDFASFKSGVQEIKKEFRNPALLSQEIICLLLKASMLKLIRKSDHPNYMEFKTDRKNSYLEIFKNLVEKHFKEMKRTGDYAKELSITGNYLNALVKEKLDISAENFIQKRVILEAERFLLNTHLSVTEISYELGFSDKSHFGKYFKRITEESPNQFRKKFQNKK